MDKHKEAIKDYELKRQVLVKLNNKRNSLVSKCTKDDILDYDSKICLKKAYDEQRQMCKENNEYYSFEEVLNNGECEGKYCKNCCDSYRLKIGELATAKMEFGNAKRRLSWMGKALTTNKRGIK